MKTLRRSTERGHSQLGWLDSHHTFSFSDYYDPEHRGYRTLRVINDDRVAPGQGFGTHPHRDMEIITHVLNGRLAHRDSMGHTEYLEAGEVQVMSAGSGLTHSEFNASDEKSVHFYQIWILPDQKGLEPSYGQRDFAATGRRNQWQLIAQPHAESGNGQSPSDPNALPIHQDALLWLADLDAHQQLEYTLPPDRGAWLQVLEGKVDANGVALATGDGLALADEPVLQISSGTDAARLLLFDLA